MTNNKFNKAPLSPFEKEKKAEEFIGFLETKKNIEESPRSADRKLEKDVMKSFPFRIPVTLYRDWETDRKSVV